VPVTADENGDFRRSWLIAFLDLTWAATVNGATAGRGINLYSGHLGAIAQLGERIVRNDEVGGSIPPGSTTLRPSGYAWRSHVMPEGRSVVPGEAQRAKTGRFDNT
jgi:hypothetical protein